MFYNKLHDSLGTKEPKGDAPAATTTTASVPPSDGDEDEDEEEDADERAGNGAALPWPGTLAAFLPWC